MNRVDDTVRTGGCSLESLVGVQQPHLLAGREHLHDLGLAAAQEEGVHAGALGQALAVRRLAAADQVHQLVVLVRDILLLV